MDNGNILIKDSETLKECNTLVEESGKIQAISGKHDDLIMAMAIGVRMAMESRKEEIYNDPSKYFLIG